MGRHMFLRQSLAAGKLAFEDLKITCLSADEDLIFDFPRVTGRACFLEPQRPRKFSCVRNRQRCMHMQARD